MSPKIKNIIILLLLAVALFLAYFFFIKGGEEDAAGLISSPAAAPVSAVPKNLSNGDFLSLLLNVKNIKLEESILSDPAFDSLFDSSISITPDGTEGRLNPFAPLGFDIMPSFQEGAQVAPPSGGSVPKKTN